ncbi:thiol:disulfide interchange protein DsbD (plasmid) [Legionella adelaidensis]|nr:thioredoxin fold domain-containing protein [Legionella adelaidensis]VEH85565.1 thiol:disulfide interchange protein DsbD [Legionella adelaidensis]
MLDRILPAFLTMALWGCLCVFSGIYMGALLKAESNAGKLRQGLGIIFLLYGLLIIIGASKGNTNPFQPLVTPTNLASSTEIDKVVRTLPEAQQAIQLASGQPILLDFYADWCTSCKLIKATTLKDIEVKNQLKNFAVITVDLSANNEASKELLNYFKVVAPPTFLFLNDKGQEVRKLRLVGEIDKNTLLAKSKHLM